MRGRVWSPRRRAPGRFLPLTVSPVGVLVLAPLTAEAPMLTAVLDSLLLLAAVWAMLDRPISLALLSVALVVALSLRWTAHSLGQTHPGLVVATHVAVAGFFALLTGMVLVQEVLCGQLYLAAFVARLVGALGGSGGEPDREG